MRIPTSVIVMSLLTAAPFGLAIRDTLNKKHDVIEDEDDSLEFDGRRSARQDREALAEYEAEMAREAEERARKREAQLEQLDELFGQKPASMGTRLAGITLGTPAADLETARDNVAERSRDGFMSVSYDYTDQSVLRGVVVELDANNYDPDTDQVINTCGKLSKKLVAAWGPSTSGVWLDPSTQQRANLDQASCKLTFDQYLEPADWLANVSLESVGKAGDKLFDKVGADIDDEYADWSLPGLGAGSFMTQVSATTKKGRIVGLHASVKTDFESAIAVRDAISRKLKAEPTTDEDTGAWIWKKKVPVTLSHDDYQNQLVLRAGNESWE